MSGSLNLASLPSGCSVSNRTAERGRREITKYVYSRNQNGAGQASKDSDGEIWSRVHSPFPGTWVSFVPDGSLRFGTHRKFIKPIEGPLQGLRSKQKIGNESAEFLFSCKDDVLGSEADRGHSAIPFPMHTHLPIYRLFEGAPLLEIYCGFKAEAMPPRSCASPAG